MRQTNYSANTAGFDQKYSAVMHASQLLQELMSLSVTVTAFTTTDCHVQVKCLVSHQLSIYVFPGRVFYLE